MINENNKPITSKMEAHKIEIGRPFGHTIINAEQNKKELEKYVDDMFKKDFHETGEVTSVMIINASDDPANERYINQKKKLLDSFGIRCFVKKFEKCYRQWDVGTYIEEHQDEFTAVMIQSPVYDHLNYEGLIKFIDYKKDIDGLHPMNQGLLYASQPDAIIPCTALGVYRLICTNNIYIHNRKVVIVGRGKLVADPLAKMLENHNCTVTKIHTKTDPEFAKQLIKNAEIIISCAGRDLSHMINPSTVGNDLEAIIGVGFRYEDGKQLQDFDCNANWGDNVKVTSNTKSTGLATVCALVDNLIQIKNR